MQLSSKEIVYKYQFEVGKIFRYICFVVEFFFMKKTFTRCSIAKFEKVWQEYFPIFVLLTK